MPQDEGPPGGSFDSPSKIVHSGGCPLVCEYPFMNALLLEAMATGQTQQLSSYLCIQAHVLLTRADVCSFDDSCNRISAMSNCMAMIYLGMDPGLQEFQSAQMAGLSEWSRWQTASSLPAHVPWKGGQPFAGHAVRRAQILGLPFAFRAQPAEQRTSRRNAE